MLPREQVEEERKAAYKLRKEMEIQEGRSRRREKKRSKKVSSQKTLWK